jgi:ABC-2 type transport system permease protein
VSREAWEVARWEFLRTVRERAFLIATLLMPLVILLLALGVPRLIEFFTSEESRFRAVAVVDDAGLYPALEQALQGTPLQVQPARGRSEAELRGLVAQGDLDGLLILSEDAVETGIARLLVGDDAGGMPVGVPRWAVWLEQALSALLLEARLQREGISPETWSKLQQPIQIHMERLGASEEPERRGAGSKMAAVFVIVLLASTFLTGPMYLLSAVIAEKDRRVTELVISAIPPQSWMDGKILGYTGVSLLQALVWSGVGLVFFSLAQRLWDFPPLQIAPAELALYGLYFVLGNLLINAFYAAVAATMKDLSTSSGFQSYAMMVSFAGLPLLYVAYVAPEGVWTRALSFVPIVTPYLMPVRLAMSEVPPWEIAGTLLALVLGVYALRRLAGKIFRVGMLSYGQQASLKDIGRWLRA